MTELDIKIPKTTFIDRCKQTIQNPKLTNRLSYHRVIDSERGNQPLTRGEILRNYPPGRRGGTGPWPHNMRGPTLCGAAPPLAQACGPTICEAPLYVVPLPPSDYIALDIRFGGERHRIFLCLAYSSATGRCHPPFPKGTSFVSSVC